MLTLIVNPVAGHGLALKTHKKVCRYLESIKMQYHTCMTSVPGEAERISRSLAEQNAQAAAILGGDGTVNEVVNGLAGSNVACYFVPCGTGNDFVKVLNLPQDPIEALSKQLAAPATRIDLGRMNDRIFANISGIGFDVQVLLQTARFKNWGRGIIPYLFGVIAAIRHFSPINVKVSFDEQPERDMGLTLMSIGNGQFYGGGMKAVPTALIDDGLFDVITVDPLKNKGQILKLLPMFVTGKHIAHPIAHFCRCKKLSLYANEDIVINLDGELISCRTAHFELMEKALLIHKPVL
ncbi:MAG: diacylglycerol kinase family lipid kinase [Clostridiales bacterium]|nr:diacylglycerol kinase family lipid kinase [Clostridiales bacterium]